MKNIKPLTGKKLDTLISKLYTQSCSGIQIDIMDTVKVFKVGVAAYQQACARAGQLWTAEAVEAITKDSIRAYVETIRKN